MGRATKVSDRQITEVLQQKGGNVLLSAEALGIARSALYARINNSAELKAVLTDAREGMVDIAESALKREVLNGNITAIIFTLKTLGKQRGYVERQEVTGADGKALKAYVSISPDDWDDGKGAE